MPPGVTEVSLQLRLSTKRTLLPLRVFIVVLISGLNVSSAPLLESLGSEAEKL